MSKKLSPLERLDLVLKSIAQHSNPDIDMQMLYSRITQNNFNSAFVDGWIGVDKAVKKLLKDGFISEAIRDATHIDEKGEKTEYKIAWYSITFEGEVFLEQGGYISRSRKETILADLQSVQTWAIAVGTLGLLIWEIWKYTHNGCS
jgi:hypothetical protein